jgi:hypothetical protein
MMKKLSVTFLALGMVCLLSIQANAYESISLVRHKKQPVYVQPTQTNVQPVAQWVSSSGQVIVPTRLGSQSTQEWSGKDETSQQLQQFSKQAQNEFANFNKL